MKRGLWIGLLVLTLTPGCTLGPKYTRPTMELPQTWRQPGPAASTIANTAWWDLYEDQVLQDLIHEALRENRDVQIAAARVAQSRAFVGYTRADQYPSFGYSASAARGLESRDILPGTETANEFRAGIDVSYEADFWGKYSRSTEAARADLVASEEARRAVIISLVGEVARAYFELRDLDGQAEIARLTLQSRREQTKLVRARADGGIASDLDLRQAEIEETIAESTLTDLQRQIVQKENQISALLGRFPGPVARGKTIEEQRIVPEVPPGLPSELLERRPDVLAVEAELRAQTARVGVAIAMRFPSFPLTGSAGLASRDLSDLTAGGTTFWGIAGAILGPIFEFGKNKQRVEVERARMDEVRLRYEKAVLEAFREVEDALVAVRKYKDQREVVERQVSSARDALRLSTLRYDGGVSSYLEVLIQERTLFDTELQLSQVRRLELVSMVQLYKGLGGGWSPEEPATAPVAAR